MKKLLHPKKRAKNGKKSTQKKYSLRGKPVDLDESQKSSRVPGIDKGKVVIMLDFDAPLPEFE